MRERVAEGSAEEVAAEAADAPAAIRLPPGGTLTPHAMLGLQRAAGNRAAVAMLSRAPTATETSGRLATGSKGARVTDLQMQLNQLDEVRTELAVDGIYGPITTKAVKEFQAAHAPLKANGVADADTQAAVAEALTEEQDPVEVGRKLFNLGGTAFERRKFGHAYAFFTRAGELTDRPGILFSRAQSLRRLGGRREEAIALYEQYLARGGGTRDADAEAALLELKTPEATGDEAVDTATARTIFSKGGALFEARDYAHAYDEFTKAGELADRPGIVFSRAQSLRRLGGRREEAIALYEQYLAKRRRHPRRRRPRRAGRAARTGGHRRRDRRHRDREGHLQPGRRAVRGRATTATPTTSSPARASSPTAPGSSSHGLRRCASSAAARTRR